MFVLVFVHRLLEVPGGCMWLRGPVCPAVTVQ